MTTIDTERLHTTFLELVQIDSPSGQEAEVASYCKQALEEAGCTVRFDHSQALTESNTGNLFATLAAVDNDGGTAKKQGEKPLFFSAHMDCVAPCQGVKPIIKDGYIYSDGTTVLGGDDKVGVAAIIEMVRCLTEGARRGESHPEIRVLFSVREEQGLVGAKAMDEAEFSDTKGAYCFVLDAAGKPGLIVNGAPYQHSYRVEYRGVASHAGMSPEKGVSAIRAAAKAVAQLPQGRIDHQTTTNVGTITGGTANNIVADECIVTGELRSHDEERLLAVRQEIDTIFKAATEDDRTGSGAPQMQLEWEVNYEGFFTPEDAPQVQLALLAARDLGLEARTEIGNGGADTNVLISYGLAAVSLGSGMDRVHSTQERLALADLEDLARLALHIVKESQKEK